MLMIFLQYIFVRLRRQNWHNFNWRFLGDQVNFHNLYLELHVSSICQLLLVDSDSFQNPAGQGW